MKSEGETQTFSSRLPAQAWFNIEKRLKATNFPAIRLPPADDLPWKMKLLVSASNMKGSAASSGATCEELFISLLFSKSSLRLFETFLKTFF